MMSDFESQYIRLIAELMAEIARQDALALFHHAVTAAKDVRLTSRVCFHERYWRSVTIQFFAHAAHFGNTDYDWYDDDLTVENFIDRFCTRYGIIRMSVRDDTPDVVFRLNVSDYWQVISYDEHDRLQNLMKSHAESLGASSRQIAIFENYLDDLIREMREIVEHRGGDIPDLSLLTWEGELPRDEELRTGREKAEEAFLDFMNVTIPNYLGVPPTRWGMAKIIPPSVIEAKIEREEPQALHHPITISVKIPTMGDLEW